MDYVQVPKEDKLAMSRDDSEENGETAALSKEAGSSQPDGSRAAAAVSDAESAQRANQQRVADLVKQMSMSAEFSTNDSGMVAVFHLLYVPTSVPRLSFLRTFQLASFHHSSP
jgi:hypothetical protein